MKNARTEGFDVARSVRPTVLPERVGTLTRSQALDVLAERLANPDELRSEVAIGTEMGLAEDVVRALLGSPDFRARVFRAREAWLAIESDLGDRLEKLALLSKYQAMHIRADLTQKLLRFVSSVDLDRRGLAQDWKGTELDALLAIERVLSKDSEKVVVQNVSIGQGNDLTDAELDRAIEAQNRHAEPSADSGGVDAQGEG